MKVKIPVRTVTKHKIVDQFDFYQKVYNYLLAKKMEFCFLPDGHLITRETCQRYLSN